MAAESWPHGCDRQQKWSEACTDASLNLFVSKRLSRKLLRAEQQVNEKESKEGHTLFWYPGAGTIRGAAGLAESLEARRAPLWCLEGRPHPAALQATRCLARAWHRWKRECVVALTDWFLDMSRISARYVNVQTWSIFAPVSYMRCALVHANWPKEHWVKALHQQWKCLNWITCPSVKIHNYPVEKNDLFSTSVSHYYSLITLNIAQMISWIIE